MDCMKIPRIWARICIVCIWIVGLAIVLRLFMNNQMPIFIGIAAFIVAIIIKYTVIRCLNCGLRGGIPQW